MNHPLMHLSKNVLLKLKELNFSIMICIILTRLCVMYFEKLSKESLGQCMHKPRME